MRVNCNQPCQALHERRQNREALFFFWEQINKMSFKMKSDSCNRCVKVLFIHAPHEVNSIIVLCQCRLSIVSKTAHYLKTMFSRIIVNVNSAYCVEVSSFYSVWCILRADWERSHNEGIFSEENVLVTCSGLMISCVNGAALSSLRSHTFRTIWSHLRAQKLKFELRLTSPVLLAKQHSQVITVRVRGEKIKSRQKDVFGIWKKEQKSGKWRIRLSIICFPVG